MILNNNKKAGYLYHILETFNAGIVLNGADVKPIKNNKVSISESYCYILNGDVYIKNINVSDSNIRDRKLLLTRKEINKIYKMINPGITIIPLKLYINGHGLIKLEIGVCKGKKAWDKRNSIKEKDLLKKNLTN